MIDTLTTYLVHHHSVSIPGLGTIYIERIPAQVDFINKQILAPSYHYRFDKFHDSPHKDFFHFLASSRQMPDYEAIKYYNEWATEFRNRIRNNEIISLEGVGTLEQDNSGEIVFTSQGSLAAFLNPVPAERVIRNNAQHTMLVGDRETTNVEMTERLGEETYVEKESWWIYALIIAAVSLVAIFFYFNKNGMNVESTGNQQRVITR